MMRMGTLSIKGDFMNVMLHVHIFVKNPHESNTVTYAGNYQYENDTLSKKFFADGYIDCSGGEPVACFYLKDHLGNVRMVVDENGGIVQVNDYYPFGALYGSGTGDAAQRYKYNGKELEWMHGLDWYDYGARWMDPVLCRFTTMDPLCEKYYDTSPYAYCANNPMNYIDPDGMSYDWVEDKDKHIYWDPNATSQETTKEGETYLGKSVVVFEGSLEERLGKGSNLFGENAKLADVTVYGPDGKDDIKSYKGYTMSSDPNLFGVVADGEYTVYRLGVNERKGPYNSEWTLNKRGKVPALNDYNPAYPERSPGYLTGIFIHRSNNNGFAGKYWDDGEWGAVSKGCLLILPNQWDNFNRQLDAVNEFKLRLIRK